MKLQKYIQRSNTLIVLVSLITLFIIIFVFVTFLSMTILDTIENDEIVNNDIFEVKIILDEFDSTDYSNLDEQLDSINYDIVVSNNESIIYSSYEKLGRDLDEFFSRDTDKELYAIFHKERWTIIRKNVEDSNIKIYAVHGIDLDGFFSLPSETLRSYLTYILIIGLLSIFGLIVISYIFTKKMVKRIMKPINLLMDGVKRVENNNLNQDIEYEGEEEFEKLCENFNEMQVNLLNEMKKNTAYDKARTDMISGISHDLRTPLTSIKGFLQGMKEGVANTPEKRDKYLEICYNKANEMDDLLKQFYYYSKVETKVMPFHFEEVDLNRIIHHLVTSKQADMTDTTELVYEIPSNQMMCMIDPDQFYRVFVNIIENSIKYAQSDHLVIGVKLEETEESYRLVIADNGVGVEEDKLDSVFNQFYRGDEFRNSQIEGSGLGLYLTKEIINRHHGSIKAENDNGFKVTITLPKDRKES